MPEGDELAALGLTELLDAARALAVEISSRMADPGLTDVVERFPLEPDVDRSGQWGLSALAALGTGTGPAGAGAAGLGRGPGGSLPVIQLQVEDLARQVDAARTALAGHVDRVFDAPVRRREVLGIPVGKNAYRNSAEYLCQHLRIRRSEARKRIGRAGHVMTHRSPDQAQVLPPAMPVLSGVVQEAQADVASVDIVADTLVAARRDATLAGADPRLVDGLVSDGERVLASQSKDTDPDTVRKACAYWRQRFDALANPDGAEPTEAQAKAVQGLFYRGRGAANLHEWRLLASDAQHEVLKTITAAASSYRRSAANPPAAIGPPASQDPLVRDAKASTVERGRVSEGPAGQGVTAGDVIAGGNRSRGGDAEPDTDAETDEHRIPFHDWSRSADAMDALETRTRGQRELDGLISALIGALALTPQDAGTLGAATFPGSASTSGAAGAPGHPGAHDGTHDVVRPDAGAGGARPQVLVTIDYQTLAGRLEEAGSTGTLISQAAYTGPVTPRTIRQLACDADLIPVVLGGKGEVLDLGRAHRLFPRRLRRAIMARDGGCAAPACSIPAPWCEVHHIDHWENGGPTSVDNGVLLCSHHHHAVHAGTWEISVRDGVPWFIPARHHDPERRPRRNRYWRPQALDEAA